jgi:uncharacterized membrane protein YGL010W
MGRTGLFDLEKHFAFYGAYHRNPINIAIHGLFVWPIFFSALIFLYFTPPFFGIPNFEFLLFGNYFVLVWNFGFLITLVYSVFYASLDLKAGSLSALLCFVCWVASSFVAYQFGWSLAWKVNNVVTHLVPFLYSFFVCMLYPCLFLICWSKEHVFLFLSFICLCNCILFDYRTSNLLN